MHHSITAIAGIREALQELKNELEKLGPLTNPGRVLQAKIYQDRFIELVDKSITRLSQNEKPFIANY